MEWFKWWFNSHKDGLSEDIQLISGRLSENGVYMVSVKGKSELEEKGYGDMIPSPTDSFTPEVKVDSYLSRIFKPIKNTKDRFNNWWRGLYKEKQLCL